MLIVQISVFQDDGDASYRLSEPSRFLARLPGVTVVECHAGHRLLPRLAAIAEILILPLIHDWDFLPVIEARRAAGLVTVLEANDDFFDVQPWNPIAESWRDPAIRAEMALYLTICDAVQTTTETLAALWRRTARRVAVFANQLPTLPALPPPQDRPLTIGWGGSPGHFADWYAVAPCLQNWLESRPDIRLAVMCQEIAKPFIRLSPERYRFAPFGSLAAYMEFVRGLDIGIAPLLPTAYNRGRSDTKFLEYAACGVAGLYADLAPYRDSVEADVTGLFYAGDKTLIDGLDRLADDAALRRRIRDAAHAHVGERRMLTDHIGARLAFYRSLLPAPPKEIAIPPDILAACESDGRYHRLYPGEAEQALRAGTSRNPADAVASLGAAADRFPDFHALALTLGRRLNEANREVDARDRLQRAMALNPNSADTMCELGRAYFRDRAYGEARYWLLSALALHPVFQPGWLYWLRFLQVTRAPDGARWAARGRALFPDDLTLALLALPLYPQAQRIGVLDAILHSPSTRPAPDRAGSIAALTQAIAETIAAIPTNTNTPDAQTVAFLRRACSHLPDSARLADLLGAALFAQGALMDSAIEHRRALRLREIAKTYAAEFAQENTRPVIWQVADHLLQHVVLES